MLESYAVITRIEDDATFVQTETPGSCGSDSCGVQGCGSAMLMRIFSQRPRALRVSNTIGARVGEHVIVGLEEADFLRSTLLGYGAPLAAFVMGAAVTQALAAPGGARDLYAALGGVLALVAAFVLVKFRTTDTRLGAILRRA
jgi:sigma-E factor negative regulatory protein RseC